jgi:hypothetical protein
LIDEKIKIYTFNYSGKDVYNVGIDNLKLNTQIFEKDKPVSFDVTVTNYSSGRLRYRSVFVFKKKEALSKCNFGKRESALTLEGRKGAG